MSNNERVVSAKNMGRQLHEQANLCEDGKVVIASAVWDRCAGSAGEDILKGYTIRIRKRSSLPRFRMDEELEGALRRLNERSRDLANLPETQEAQLIRILKARSERP